MSVLLRTGVMKYKVEGSNTWHPIILQAQVSPSLQLTTPSFSSLPQTISNASITSDYVVASYHLSNPNAQLGDWTITTATGSLTIAGTMNANNATTVTMVLVKPEILS